MVTQRTLHLGVDVSGSLNEHFYHCVFFISVFAWLSNTPHLQPTITRQPLLAA